MIQFPIVVVPGKLDIYACAVCGDPITSFTVETVNEGMIASEVQPCGHSFLVVDPATRWGDCLVGKSGCKIPGPHQHGVEDRRKQ